MALERKTWDGYANWEEVAATEDEAYVRRRITGLASGEWRENATPKDFGEALAKLKDDCQQRRGHAGHVVDFGCGLGRNAPFLRAHFARVVGIDLPDMVKKLRDLPAANTYDSLYDDLEKLSAAEDIDVLYDSVVLQHMVDEEFVATLISKLAALPNLKYVVSLCNNIRAVPGKRGWPRALVEMTKLGWKVTFATLDYETFNNKPHHLRIMVKPE